MPGDDRFASDRRGLNALLGDALRESATLARKEFALFRAEIDENFRSFVIGIVLIVAASVFAVAAVLLLTGALVAWLAVLLDLQALAALLVALAALLVALGLGLWGYSKLSSASLTPKRSLRSMQRDAEIVTERAR